MDTNSYEDLLNNSGAESVTDQLDVDVQSILEQWGLSQTQWDGISDSFTLSSVWNVIGNFFQDKVGHPLLLLGSLLTVILFATLYGSLQSNRLESHTSHVWEYVTTIAAAFVLIQPLSNCFDSMESALQQGAEFMLLFVPVFAGILAAGGMTSQAVFYQTAILALSDTVLQLICHVLLPLCSMCFALAIIDAVSPNISVSGILRLIRKAVTWLLGLFMAIFLSVMSMQNHLGSSADTAISRSVKYVVSSFVPIVGNAVSDAYTTVKSSLALLQNSTGVIGIAALYLLFYRH